MPDYELWQALHHSCPNDGCGHCSRIDVDLGVDPDILERAAQRHKLSVDAYIHMCITLGMRNEMQNIRS